MISGGAGQSDLVRQLLADAAGLPVMSVTADEPVLLGSAILGAVAGDVFADIPTAMAAMSHRGRDYLPSAVTADSHRRRYDVFRALQDAARRGRG